MKDAGVSAAGVATVKPSTAAETKRERMLGGVAARAAAWAPDMA